MHTLICIDIIWCYKRNIFKSRKKIKIRGVLRLNVYERFRIIKIVFTNNIINI